MHRESIKTKKNKEILPDSITTNYTERKQLKIKNKNHGKGLIDPIENDKKEMRNIKPVKRNKTGAVYQGKIKKFDATSDENADSSISGINWGLNDGA